MPVQRSKYAIAGPSISDFIKHGPGYVGCWVCPDAESNRRLQRLLKTAAFRAGLDVKLQSFVGVASGDRVLRCLIGEIRECET